MGFSEILGIIGGIFFAAGFVPYTIEALKGKATPNRATWLVWSVLGIILLISYYYSTENHEMIWMPVASAIGPIIIFILAIKKGEGGWTSFDRNCLIGAGIMLLLWYITDWAILALQGALFIDMLGFLPTLKKVIQRPESESLPSWLFWWIGATFSLLTVFVVGEYTWAAISMPLWFFIVTGTMSYLQIRPKIKRDSL